MSEQYNTTGGVVAQQINSNCILRITTRKENYLGRDCGPLNTQSNSYEMVCSVALSALSAPLQIPQITQIHRSHHVTPHVTRLPFVPWFDWFQRLPRFHHYPAHFSFH